MIPKLQFLCIWVTLDLVLPVLVQRLVPLGQKLRAEETTRMFRVSLIYLLTN